MRALASLCAADLLWPPAPGGSRELGSRFDVAPHALHAEEALALVAPGALVERPFGRGRVLVDVYHSFVRENEPATSEPATTSESATTSEPVTTKEN